METTVGLEPTSLPICNRMPLPLGYVVTWLVRQGSNLKPPGSEPGVLPIELRTIVVGGGGGN